MLNRSAIEQEYRSRHPGMSWNDWRPKRYAQMVSKIQGWTRLYDPSIVLLLVTEEKRTTRSPGKIEAIDEWLSDRELQGLLET